MMRQSLLIGLLVVCTSHTQAQLDSLKSIFRNITGKEKNFILSVRDTLSTEYQAIAGGLRKIKEVSAVSATVHSSNIVMVVVSKRSADNLWKEMPDDVRNRFTIKKESGIGVFQIIDNKPQDAFVKNTAGPNTSNEGTSSQPGYNAAASNNTDVTTSQKRWDWENSPVKLPATYSPPKAVIDSLNKLSRLYVKNKIASIAIVRMASRVPKEDEGKQAAERLIAYLRSTEKIRTYPEPVHHIPDGAQLLITGKMQEFHSSTDAYGRPKIEISLELRPATAQKQVLLQHTIKKTGNIHPGKGENEALEKLWHACILDAASFIIKNAKSWENLAKARTSKEEIAGVELEFDEMVQTKDGMESQQDYGEDMRRKGRKRNLGLSEYYNDSMMTTIYPKIKGDQYLEFKINGAKQTFNYGSKKLDENMSVSFKHNIWGIDGFEIKISSVNIAGNMSFMIFDPMNFKTARRFYFGDKDIVNENIPGERHEVEFIANLFKDYKIDKMMGKKLPTGKFLVIASNKTGNKKSTNVVNGYVDVIRYSTGAYGELEVAFNFKTKAITDAAGKVVQQPATVEGRMRIRGSFRPPISDSF